MKLDYLKLTGRKAGCTSFLVTLLTGKRLIPCRTQKLSPSRPMVVRKRESRSSPGIIRPVREQRAGLSFCAVARASCPCMAVLHSPTAAAVSGSSSRVGRGASCGVRIASSAIPPAFRLPPATSRPGVEASVPFCDPCPVPGTRKTQHQELKIQRASQAAPGPPGHLDHRTAES